MADRVYLGEATMPVVIDEALDSSSTNPVQNKVVTQALAGKEATISDLATIRSGAALGATSIQPSDVVSTYSPTGTAPVNGAAVNEALSSAVGMPLFSFTFADHLLDSTNWLRADTFSWQDGEVYTSAYQHLVDDIAGKTSETETIGSITITFYRATDGHKICLANQAGYVSDLYDATGVAWYYILDTANTRFKLPRMLPLGDTAPVVGNGQTMVLTDGTHLASLSTATSNLTQSNPVGGAVGTNTSSGRPLDGAKIIGVTTDPTKSGLIANLSHTSNDRAYKYLYFYVGNTVQSQTTIDVGQITEDLNGKVDLDLSNVSNTGKSTCASWAMPSTVSTALTLGASGTEYTAPANGYVVLAVTSGLSYFYLVNKTTGLASGVTQGGAGFTCRLFIPVKKNEKFEVDYQLTPDAYIFAFIYAEGSKTEA